MCLASHRQQGHKETAPPFTVLGEDLKLGFYTVPTGNRTPGRHVAVHSVLPKHTLFKVLFFILAKLKNYTLFILYFIICMYTYICVQMLVIYQGDSCTNNSPTLDIHKILMNELYYFWL